MRTSTVLAAALLLPLFFGLVSEEVGEHQRGPRGRGWAITAILFVFALPLLLALIALVADGSNLFANKRGVQNVSDATVEAGVL